MARWKLGSSHYLNTVQSEQWEYIEEGRIKGPLRKRFNVPRFLNILDPKCYTRVWGPTNDLEGEIIVCLPGRGDPSDIEFLGDPTPEMFPIDDEAKAISAKLEPHWKYKPDSEILFSQSLVESMQDQAAAKQAAPQQVEVAGLADLVAAIGGLVAAQAHSASTSRRG